MSMLTHGSAGTDPQASAVYDAPKTEVVLEKSSLDLDQPLTMHLQQRHFASGGMLLTLEREPALRVYPATSILEVEGWGIQLRFIQIGDIARELMRKFLLLHRKAESMQLTEQETEEWTRIVNDVDYQKFMIENAPPVYVEGRLEQIAADDFLVRWHDDSTEHIAKSTAKGLEIVNEGESFSGRARLGTNNRLLSIEDVSPIPESAQLGDDAWPTLIPSR